MDDGLDPEIRQVLAEAEARGVPADLSMADARVAHDAEGALLGGPGEPVAEVVALHVPGPAGEVPVRVYRPASLSEATPGVVAYLHGGGWCVGSCDGFDTVCRALANASGAVVASVEYRLAPEHPFPAGLEDAEAVVRWLAEHAADVGADPGRLAVAGDSAGGNLAAVVARRLRDAGGPPVRLQALIYPVTDAACDTPSYRENATGFGLTAEGMRRYWGLYLGDADGSHPDCSPLRATDLTGLPPAFVLSVDKDVLRDEGEAYARALEAAGVPVELRRYDGAVHGCWRWLARARLSRLAVEEVAGALAAALR